MKTSTPQPPQLYRVYDILKEKYFDEERMKRTFLKSDGQVWEENWFDGEMEPLVPSLVRVEFAQ